MAPLACVDDAQLAEACAAFELAGASVEPVALGNINRTYILTVKARPGAPAARFVLQRLNPIFRPELHHDIARVTEHLQAKGLTTPLLRRTQGGQLWYDDRAQVAWRVLTFVSGIVHPRVLGPDLAHAAGHLLGRFHRALADLDHTFRFAREGVHDTPAHLRRLEAAIAAHPDHPGRDQIEPVAQAILAAADRLPALGELPNRTVHGDPKVENMVFDGSGRGRALLDLDTLNRMPTVVELGDALRSWCNPAGENAAEAAFAADHMAAALAGYARGADGLLSADEQAQVPTAVATIALELAARFARDAYEQRYFHWDQGRYATAWEHNLVRARGQLSLRRSMPPS